MRTNSNPGETRNRSRPSSIVADDNLDDMLTRVKKLKEERQQILKDMAMLKDATSEEANETSDATTNDTTTNKESPISDDTDKDICDRGRQGSIDSGIGPSKSVTTDGGSSVVETRRVSHTSNRTDDDPNRTNGMPTATVRHLWPSRMLYAMGGPLPICSTPSSLICPDLRAPKGASLTPMGRLGIAALWTTNCH